MTYDYGYNGGDEDDFYRERYAQKPLESRMTDRWIAVQHLYPRAADAPFPHSDPDDELGIVPPAGWMEMPFEERFGADFLLQNNKADYGSLAVGKNERGIVHVHYTHPTGEGTLFPAAIAAKLA